MAFPVHFLPGLDATNWTGSFRGLQDLQSSEPLVTADVPGFFRIVGSSNALHVRELQSLVDFGRFDPALPSGHPFTDWQADSYWSSTMLADPSGDAWFMRLIDGYSDVSGTTALNNVWPVRGGE